MKMNVCVPCLFGLEGLVGDELRRLDIQDVRPETGRVYFTGTFADIAKANICLRTGERVLITLGSFSASTFEELYQGAKALDWASFIPKEGAFPVKGHALGPALRSVPDAQRTIKKAAAEVLGVAYGMGQLPETGVTYQIQFAIRDDICTIYLDTTGAGLYKRGYRPQAGIAPLRETLAAAMVILSRYRGRDVVLDPFCGAGTISIEAALIARNRAPGIRRRFTAEHWTNTPQEVWEETRKWAKSREYDGDYQIFASDVDPNMENIVLESAKAAGVSEDITFSVADARQLVLPAPKGVIITNPPYGERVLEREEALAITRDFGKQVKNVDQWDKYIISAHPDFEQAFGKQASKKRKLYNGMIKSNLFMYR